MREDITPEHISRMRELRAAGLSWAAIGSRFGLSKNTVRYRLDEVYAAMVRRNAAMLPHRAQPGRIAPADEARALATVQLDTRSRLARFFGDPIPGRSALDLRSRNVDKPSILVNFQNRHEHIGDRHSNLEAID